MELPPIGSPLEKDEAALANIEKVKSEDGWVNGWETGLGIPLKLCCTCG